MTDNNNPAVDDNTSIDERKKQVYLDYYNKVYAYVRRKTAKPQEAEDIVSSVFLRVYERLDSFDPSKASISTWIYTITHNIVIDYYRKYRTNTEYSDYMTPEIDEFASGNDNNE